MKSYSTYFFCQYVYIIDQARGQDGWILAEFSFCVFMDRDEVEVHKNVKRERGQYPAILTELAWSIKDLLYGIKSTEKNDLRTCLFSTFLFSLFSLSLTLSVFPFSGSSKTKKSQKVFLYKQKIISAKENFRAPA